MLAISRDEFLKWCCIYIGQRLVKDQDFKDRVQGILVSLGEENIYSVKRDNRIPFMCWVERELI